MHTALITLASVSSLSASWLHLPLCWFCSGHLVVVGAAVQVILSGSTTFLPVSSRCLETLCLGVFFPLTNSPATSARGRSLTTSAAKSKELWVFIVYGNSGPIIWGSELLCMFNLLTTLLFCFFSAYGPYRLNRYGLAMAIVMKYAVDEINANQTLLPGIKLGFEIHDTCGQSAIIMRPTISYLTAKSKKVLFVQCNYTSYETSMAAVIGPNNSEMVSVIGKLLGFFLMPQVWFSMYHMSTLLHVNFLCIFHILSKGFHIILNANL